MNLPSWERRNQHIGFQCFQRKNCFVLDFFLNFQTKSSDYFLSNHNIWLITCIFHQERLWTKMWSSSKLEPYKYFSYGSEMSHIHKSHTEVFSESDSEILKFAKSCEFFRWKLLQLYGGILVLSHSNSERVIISLAKVSCFRNNIQNIASERFFSNKKLITFNN